MYAYITISNVGADAGPFNLYSDVDGFLSAFETNLSASVLEAGYPTFLVPDGTTIIKIQSVNKLCNNFVNVGTVSLEYYFEPDNGTVYQADFIESGTYAYVYGYYTGYFSGNASVPGNHIVKLNSDRSADLSFDVGEGLGFHTVFLGATLTELSDLSIVLVGFFTTFNGETVNRILKLLPDGSRDSSFDTGIGFNNYTTSVQQDGLGRLYITGIFNAYKGTNVGRGIIRLLSDGSLDPTYNTGTGFNNAAVFSLLNPDNSIFISGYFTTYKGVSCPTGIIKLDENGNVDPTFDGGTGFNVTNLQPVSMARISGETSFYCAGYFTQYKGVNQSYIVKLQPNGDVDTSFNAGTGFDNICGSIKVIWNNKLLVVGNFTEYNGVTSLGNIILNSDGSVYLAFDTAYSMVYVIGNDLFATELTTYRNNKIFTFSPDFITTTTTTTTII